MTAAETTLKSPGQSSLPDARRSKQFGRMCAAAFVLAIPHFGQASPDIGAKVILQKDTALIAATNSIGTVLLEFEVDVRGQMGRPTHDLVYSDVVIIERGKKQQVAFFQDEFAKEGPDFEGRYLVAFYRFITEGDSIKVQVKLKDKRRSGRGLQLLVIAARLVEVKL